MLKPIPHDMLPTALDLLCEGFPDRSRAFWQRGLDRLLEHDGNRTARFPIGFFWVEKGDPVGIALTPASPRSTPGGGTLPLVNFSSWYLKPDFRWKAPLMLRALFKDPDAVYLDLTPTPEVQKMLPIFGFHAVNAGIAYHALPLVALRRGERAAVRVWRASDELPPGSPPAGLIEQHRQWGCLAIVIEQQQGPVLVVVRPFRYRGLPAASLIYIGSHRAVETSLPALARFLLGHGFLVAQSDVRQPPRFGGLGFRSRGIWFAKGDSFADRTDHIGSELCLFDL